jgi:hypothetical protein
MAKALCHLNPNGSKYIYSFDSFEELTNPTIEEDFGESLRGKHRGDFDKLKAVISLYNFINEVFLRPGLIEVIVSKFVEENPDREISLIYYDQEFFEPPETMFKYLTPRLNIGGIILLDEYGTPRWPGETKSADIFLTRYNKFIGEKIETSKQPALKITRIS